MANLTAGQGDTLNAFDLTLATMVAGLSFIFTDQSAVAPAGSDGSTQARRATRR